MPRSRTREEYIASPMPYQWRNRLAYRANINVKNCRFITTCEARFGVTHIKQQTLISSPQGRQQHRTSTYGFQFGHGSHREESQKLCARQIWTRLFNPRFRYYYFRFRKINRRHVDILFPVFTLTIPSSSVSDSSSAYQIRRQSYDVILIYQDGGHIPTASQINLRFPLW